MKPSESIDWQHLSGPFGVEEDLPATITALQTNYSKELLDEIIWEKIYHQGTLYENTFAVIPYLIDIAASAADPAVKEDILSSVAVLISEDGNAPVPDMVPAEFHNNKVITTAQAREIFNAYLAALQQLPGLCEALIPHVRAGADDDDKTYFLAAVAVAHGQRQFARIFIHYVTGEEYMSVCPACDNEVHIWPAGDKLVVYGEDPVFNKEQQAVVIQAAAKLPSPWNGDITEMNIRDFGYHYIQALNISSLTTRWPYLTGTYNCPSCREMVDVYESIENGL